MSILLARIFCLALLRDGGTNKLHAVEGDMIPVRRVRVPTQTSYTL